MIIHMICLVTQGYTVTLLAAGVPQNVVDDYKPYLSNMLGEYCILVSLCISLLGSCNPVSSTGV